MTKYRTHLLINHQKFPTPLKHALAERGIILVENEWQPEPELLRRTLACVADFGGSVKHPLDALIWKRQLSRYGVPVFVWNRDAPHNNNLRPWRLALFDILRPLDIYATHSLVDTRWRFAETVFFLPNAADTASYNLRGEPEVVLARLRDPAQYRWDVSFFGALDGDCYKEARDRKRFFMQLANRLDVSGVRYRFVDTLHTTLSLDEQVELIQSSRINLNFGARCDFGDFVPSGLPERCFGIPACGGFLLTDRRTHTADSFVVGQQMDDFGSIDECMEKIRYYLANFERSRKLAEAGWWHIMRHHPYANRAETMHRALLDWHTSRQVSNMKTYLNY